MKRVGSVLLWSVLAAAFIGPGTVTSAAGAGAEFGTALLWALTFSTVACLVLQEAAARLTIAGRHNLAEALGERADRGWRRLAMLTLVGGAIIVGCAAYEAGNILGGVAGAEMVTGWAPERWTWLLAAAAAALLWFNAPARVARSLAVMVAVMGGAFATCAWGLRPEIGELVRGALIPSLPDGSTVLALALVGTTVVPYNLFLGSGLAEGTRLADTRFGIAVAVVLGGAISMAVVVVGAAVDGAFSFPALAEVLGRRLGPAGPWLLGCGLLAAGLSSAVTAPLAAAMTARGLARRPDAEGWSARGWRYRAVWMGVLAVGVAFGLSGVRPIPVIVVAQALNGVLLPLVAAFLFVAVNDRRRMGERSINGAVANGATAAVVAIAMLLGVLGVTRAATTALGIAMPAPAITLALAGAVTAVAAVPVGLAIVRARRP